MGGSVGFFIDIQYIDYFGLIPENRLRFHDIRIQSNNETYVPATFQ
jgi:hypothetical protein